MRFSMAPVLIYSESVPPAARSALKSAYEASPGDRRERLESAARILYAETDLDCQDARELVGLSDGGCD
jgi:hypothetical protein